MGPSPTILFSYFKGNRYSIHALAGALETHPKLRDLTLEYPLYPRDLVARAAELKRAGQPVLIAVSLNSIQFVETRQWMWKLLEVLELDQTSAPDFAHSGVFLVAGGPHPTADPLGTLNLGFQAVIAGEGEAAFVDLVLRLVENREWRDVPGMASLDEKGQLRQNAGTPPIDLNAYPPFPTRDGNRCGHIELTRGCPFACAFCQISKLHNTRPRHRSPESVWRNMEVMRKAGRTDYRFITPNAFGYGSPDGRQLNPEAVRTLLHGAREIAGTEGRIYFGSFPSEVRPEHVNDEMVAMVLEYATNTNLVIGAQSGSDRVLRLCHRGHTVDEARRAAACILRNGLKANVDFIFGLPGETEADQEATLDFMDELVALGARIHTHTFLPIPQTRFAHCPPGQITPRILEALHTRLVPSGAAYGNWREQEVLAAQIAQYRDTQTLGHSLP
ncbi:MAG TPA: TIGR04013 family B12-binding domain/radical SAM domain-containing protein [Candidatus Sumerlaeota bacterium]|nr:TIGR04013 family B12-binding domain/radical SAM domain-containing protein [Candidatus Sumerlaeota bacterium]HPS00848.1 TIGR04013 family B12-binding domain/radical SAM domain-containing protein [Candidatus Sumerlaeota bacterium]